MAKFTIDIPTGAVPLVTEALGLWAQGQGKTDGLPGDRARWALRRFIAMTVRQYRVTQAQAAADAATEAAQASAVTESQTLEDTITTS